MTKRCKMLGATAGPASALKTVVGVNTTYIAGVRGSNDFKQAQIAS